MKKNLYYRDTISSQIKLGNKVRFLRKEKGITQEELAFMMEMSPRNLSDIENGKVDCHYSTLCSLAEVLEITLPELVNFE